MLYFGLFLLLLYSADAIICGDGDLDEGEVCDSNYLNHENCTNFNYTGGSLECLDDCSGYYWGNCEGDEVCGNTVIGENEICEPNNLRNRTCVDEGYVNGTLGCRNDCSRYDYSDCGGEKAVCGDGNVTGNEECDGNLNGESCNSLNFSSGSLSCVNCGFDTSECIEEVEENITEEMNETENESVGGEVPSGVVGVVSNTESKKGMSLSNWLLIVIIVLVVGVVGIWFYIFKFKK